MAALLRAGETSSRALTEAHLEVAERQNHALNAWLVIDRAGALAQADAADARMARARRDGPAAMGGLHPLHGIPIGLKDLISVEGGQCTAGSRILAGYRAPYDAHIVERLGPSAPSSSARRTWTSSPWVPRTSTRPTDP